MFRYGTVQLALSKISSRNIFITFSAWRGEAQRAKRQEGMDEFNKLSSYAAQRVFNAHRWGG